MIKAHIAQRIRVAVRLTLAVLERLGNLRPVGVVLKRGGIHLRVIEYGAVGRHQRRALLAKVD